MPRKKAKPKKAFNGQGTVRQLPSNSYEYRFTLPGGIRKSVTARSGEEAIEKGRAIIAEFFNKPTTPVKPSEMTMKMWAERWFAQHEKEIRKSSLTCDKNTKRHIVDAFGPMLLSDIRPSHIRALLQQKLDEGKSSSLVSKIRGMLYQMLNDAAVDEIIVRNPVTLIKQKKGQRDKSAVKRDAFTPDEVVKILEAQDKSWVSRSVVMLLFTGLREGEMLALDDKFVAVDGSRVDVVRSLNIEDGKSVLGEPKSKAAVRQIPVVVAARQAVKTTRDNNSSGVLFPGRGTTYYGGSGYRKVYKTFLKSLGVRELSPHCCRHTFGTMLAAAGVAPAKIQYIMGHSDYRTTANVYTHVAEWMSPEAIALLKKWGITDLFAPETAPKKKPRKTSKKEPLEMVGDADKIGENKNPQEPHDS